MKRLAVVPGSFDPMTVGHEDLIRRAASLFGSCLVLVMNNREKNYALSLSERFELARLVFEGEENIRVASSEGMLYEYLLSLKEKTVLVKGIRNEKDLAYEQNMARFNFEKSGVETVYLDAREGLCTVSSTLIRQMNREERENCPYLSEKAVKYLQNKL
ncbi:MAG: pantetheine-phosphate adenylyltransferase [Clostridia bacterium]|nr:pantetheine-phosphate adenylyltransferase [Clostridia bacterium]